MARRTDDGGARRAAQGDLTHDGVPFIVIEDEGTVGLDGDWEQFDDNESQPADNNHFYWFFRNIGTAVARLQTGQVQAYGTAIAMGSLLIILGFLLAS